MANCKALKGSAVKGLSSGAKKVSVAKKFMIVWLLFMTKVLLLRRIRQQ